MSEFIRAGDALKRLCARDRGPNLERMTIDQILSESGTAAAPAPAANVDFDKIPFGAEKILKPIETRYGYHFFRSRLEARWSIFFDEMDIEYEYESEGFELPSGGRYLPDFWLPKYGWFVEVKPTIGGLAGNPKSVRFARETRASLMVLDGHPDLKAYHGFSTVAIDGETFFDDGPEYSLDIYWFNCKHENRFWAQPDYATRRMSKQDLSECFSAQYIGAISAARSERFAA